MDPNQKRSEKLTLFYTSDEGRLIKEEATKKRIETLAADKVLASQKTQKECTYCGLMKNTECFYRKKSSHDGYQSYCKECMKLFKN